MDSSSNITKISIPWQEAVESITGEHLQFPKYTTQLMNLANQNAQGTRPAVVGQMSELVQLCPDTSFEGWKQWYLEQHPHAIDRAVARILPMLDNLSDALADIDEAMVRRWVEDLVLVKTAEGFIIQEAILREVANRAATSFRIATPEEEAKNIDGFIGDNPVSIKPESFRSKKASVRDKITVDVIYYKRTKRYLHIFTK